jgi:ABC-type sugar transport system permease subunit/ABC-type glycerol-3-phosphate transport system substrate-binding protein
MRIKSLAYLLVGLGIMVLVSRWGDVSAVLSRLGTEGGARPKQVVEWSTSGSPDVERRRARDFEREHPDIAVELHFRESGRLQDTIYVSFLSGAPPDMLGVSFGDMREMVAAGMLRPMDDLLEASLRADPEFVNRRIGGEATLAYFQANPNDPLLARDAQGRFRHPLQAARLLHMHGRFVGFTGGVGNQTLTYNKRVFRNAARMFPDAGLVDGHGEPIPPRTWAELLDKARVITEYGRRSGEGCYGIVVQGRTPRDKWRGLEPLAATAGTRGFNFAGKRWIEGVEEPVGYFEFDHSGLIAAWKVFMLLQADGSVLPGTSSRYFEDARTAVGEGRAAMIIDGWHSALIAVERVPWAKTDIGSAPVPVPYELGNDEQRRQIEQLLGIEIVRGNAYKSDRSSTMCLTSGSRFPEAAWAWMHYGADKPEVQKVNTRRGALPGTMDAARLIDDPEWFPFPFQKQAWEVFVGYSFWPQPPVSRPVLVQDYQNVLHEAFLTMDIEPGDREKLAEAAAQVREKLARYSQAVNEDLARRVQSGEELPALWTFPDFDPVRPDAAYDRQRRASDNPELNARLQQIKAQLPAELRDVDPIAFFSGFRTSASPLNVLWGPGLLLLATVICVTAMRLRSRRPGELPFPALVKQARRSWYAYLFVLPAMLMLFSFIIYPSLYQLYLSLHEGSGIAPLTFVGLEQFGKIFRDENFWTKVLPNTAKYMVIVTTAEIVIGLLIASLLNMPLGINRVARPLFFIPLAVSLAAVSVVFLGLLGGPDSAVNGMLRWLGLERLPFWLGLNPAGGRHDWLGSPSTDLYAVMSVGIWHSLPYNIILLLAGLQSIDPQLYEAGKVDGANAWHRFRHITIPEMLPILIVITFNALIGAARAFGPVWILTEGGKNHSSELVSTYIFKWGFTKPPDQAPDIGYASALGIMYSLLLGVMVFANVWIIAQRWRKRLQIERRVSMEDRGPTQPDTTVAAEAIEGVRT